MHIDFFVNKKYIVNHVCTYQTYQTANVCAYIVHIV